MDLSFWGVDYMALPHRFKGLEIVPPTPDEIAKLESLLGRTIESTKVIVLASDGKRHSIVASSFSVDENDWDISESPIEIRSHKRNKP